MKKASICLLTASFLLLVWTSACQSPQAPTAVSESKSTSVSSSSSNSDSTTLTNGTFRLVLKDKPVEEAKNIWIKINKIQVHKATDEEGSFLTIWEDASGREIDLLVLKSTPTVLTEATLQAGKYTQIRLSVLSGKIVFAEEGKPDAEYPLDVPSDVVKIPVQFEVLADKTTQIILDFDAEKSIHVVKRGKNDSYLLRPVILVEGIQQGI